MARDLTVRINGQNSDGTFNVSMDPGNPLLAGGSASTSTALVPVIAPPMQPAQGFRARLGNMEVMFASEADYLKADRYMREVMEQQNMPQIGVPIPALGGARMGTSWLRTGAHAAEAIAGFLRDRDIRRKLDDLRNALDDSRDARSQLDTIEKGNPTLAPLIPVLRKLFIAERDATQASMAVLEDELTAVDIQTGAGVAKVAADLMGEGGSPLTGGGTTGALAAGGLGLGLGMLLSSDRDSSRRRNR